MDCRIQSDCKCEATAGGTIYTRLDHMTGGCLVTSKAAYEVSPMQEIVV